jgi:hypothetical protein
MGMKHDRVNAAAVDLHIEELVLHGFPAADRFRMGDAVERELARLIAEQGLPGFARNPVSIERLDGGAFMVAGGAKPYAIGVQLAQSLHQQLSATQKASPPNRHAKQMRPTR